MLNCSGIEIKKIVEIVSQKLLSLNLLFLPIKVAIFKKYTNKYKEYINIT